MRTFLCDPIFSVVCALGTLGGETYRAEKHANIGRLHLQLSLTLHLRRNRFRKSPANNGVFASRGHHHSLTAQSEVTHGPVCA